MKKVKLGEVATFINGYAFKPQDWSTEGKEIIRIQNLTKTSKEINYYSGKIDKKYIVETGDILISWSGTLGVFQWYGKTAVLNQHIFKAVFDKLDINKSYFKYVVEKGLQDAVKNTHGSTMKHLTKKYFDNIIVSYTSLKEQQKISRKLDLLSELISMRQEQLEELNLLVKSRFNEMFGDPISNSLKLPIKKFEKVVTLQRGFDLPIQNRQVGEINVWGSNGIVATHTESKVTEQGIVTGRSGSIGKVYVTEKEYWPLNTTLFSKELHGNNPIFLKYLLEAFKLERFNNGTGVPTLNRNIVHKEDIIYVPLALQNEFADFVAQVDKSQLAIQKSLEELETLKKSLMQEYFG